jgi:hypothetical protein
VEESAELADGVNPGVIFAGGVDEESFFEVGGDDVGKWLVGD